MCQAACSSFVLNADTRPLVTSLVAASIRTTYVVMKTWLAYRVALGRSLWSSASSTACWSRLSSSASWQIVP